MAILHSEVPTEWLTQFETQKTERKSNSIMHLDVSASNQRKATEVITYHATAINLQIFPVDSTSFRFLGP
ncbi:predicted protein [Botrytis cinerea T4]|uniref:Uncharacterized protein n=1 Tax=Botryotinia fuckeliana (strain T4) TaxID=999810 RepID=G2YB49_BOTF4|nr:predicted protein [Botrytis cinerea T4]